MKDEVTRERQGSEELKQKLAAAEKELKSSAVMNLELEDYQRSMKTLEEQLTSRSSELERVRKDGQLQQDSMMQLKKELGKYNYYVTLMLSIMFFYKGVWGVLLLPLGQILPPPPQHPLSNCCSPI